MILAEKSAQSSPGLNVLPDGTLTITPSATSSVRDFDFLEGRTYVQHRKLKERLTTSNDWFEFDGAYEIRPILNGLGNIEKYEIITNGGQSLEGMNLRLFNPDTKLWSIYWADSISGTLEAPLVGSFENGVGNFYTIDKHNGRSIIIQFRYDSTEKDNPNWRQAFSADGGQTWEWNWYMNYR
ncbi:MAG: hypothetical protein V4577_17280 [Bacteroidota bacterium]